MEISLLVNCFIDPGRWRGPRDVFVGFIELLPHLRLEISWGDVKWGDNKQRSETELGRLFHPTVARGAVGFKSNGWQLGSAGGTQCLVSSNTRQRENSPPLAVGRLEECSHSSNTPFTRLSLHESKATVTHFVSRWAAGSTLSSASSLTELRTRLSGEMSHNQ